MKNLFVVLCLATLLYGCSHNNNIKTPNNPVKDVSSLVIGNNAFAFKMYKELSQENENVLFSPYSLSTAFALVYGGTAGETEKEIASTLNFTLSKDKVHSSFKDLQKSINSSQEKKDVELNVANALFAADNLQSKFKKEYFNLVKNNYDAELSFLDFADKTKSAETINSWVDDKTNHTIEELISPDLIDQSVAMVLVDAIYFKGEWLQKFKPENTKDAKFFSGYTNVRAVPSKVMMMNLMMDFNYADMDNMQILELPYKGDEVSMLVLLPKKIDGMSELEQNLTPENLELWKSKMVVENVDVFIPKFKMMLTYDKMVNTFKKLGMNSPFGADADFSNMISNQDLFISDVIHKAFMVLNEEGTEASAATGIIMRKTAIDLNHKQQIFRADHPFICILQHKPTGSILFMTKLQNPDKM